MWEDARKIANITRTANGLLIEYEPLSREEFIRLRDEQAKRLEADLVLQTVKKNCEGKAMEKRNLIRLYLRYEDEYATHGVAPVKCTHFDLDPDSEHLHERMRALRNCLERGWFVISCQLEKDD